MPYMTTTPPLLTTTSAFVPIVASPTKMIQLPRIVIFYLKPTILHLFQRAVNRGIKYKPVDERNAPYWNEASKIPLLPDKSTPFMFHKTVPTDGGYSVTGFCCSHFNNNLNFAALPLFTTNAPSITTPGRYPLVSLFKKIFPSSIPTKFSSLFGGDYKTSEEQSVTPIAAKEVFELNTEGTSSPETTTSEFFFQKLFPSKFVVEAVIEPSTSSLAVSEKTTSPPVEQIEIVQTTTTAPLPFAFTFTSKPKIGNGTHKLLLEI